ncbi:MAG: alpha-glucosidase/alpha-galactosidase [Lentisphaerae bacterium GWF2_45_14]|nr:MAG: alpha-glucosidase/alpha-galactosidase [Lentisphaerae bacterium GWF2_45_14]
MPKITFIGAGSFGFTRTVLKDLFSYPLLEGSEVTLMDIHPGRLEMARKCCQKIVDIGGYSAKIKTTLDRREALKGADAVLITILCGKTDIWQHDILIPKKYGVDINVGDTRGPAGIFRALRTIPTMLDICKDMEELCPEAIMLNYTNPMAMLCHAMQRKSFINTTGLCHSVQGTAKMLAGWAKVPFEELDYTCAGINHLAWYLELKHKNKDIYPKLQKAVSDKKEIYNEEQVRNEMFLAFGYYVTESSGHNSEYNWWFRKRSDLIKKHCTKGTGWNPGHHAYILDHYKRQDKTWEADFNKWINNPDWKDTEKAKELVRGTRHEYASAIINAYLGGDMFRFNGNVPNTGIITNLPDGACVEVPVLASRRKLQPIYVGELPMPVLPLTHLSSVNEMMAVEGCLTGDAGLVYQSIANDPLTASVLSLAEIRKMVAEMFKVNKKYLPHFKKISL